MGWRLYRTQSDILVPPKSDGIHSIHADLLNQKQQNLHIDANLIYWSSRPPIYRKNGLVWLA